MRLCLTFSEKSVVAPHASLIVLAMSVPSGALVRGSCYNSANETCLIPHPPVVFPEDSDEAVAPSFTVSVHDVILDRTFSPSELFGARKPKMPVQLSPSISMLQSLLSRVASPIQSGFFFFLTSFPPFFQEFSFCPSF